jgi:hypothetical protein
VLRGVAVAGPERAVDVAIDVAKEEEQNGRVTGVLDEVDFPAGARTRRNEG